MARLVSHNPLDPVANHFFKYALITNRNPEADLVDIEILDSKLNATGEVWTNVPVFYHCKPDAEYNGASLKYASTAFPPGTIAIVRFEDGLPIVVSHYGGDLQPCGCEPECSKWSICIGSQKTRNCIHEDCSETTETQDCECFWYCEDWEYLTDTFRRKLCQRPDCSTFYVTNEIDGSICNDPFPFSVIYGGPGPDLVKLGTYKASTCLYQATFFLDMEIDPNYCADFYPTAPPEFQYLIPQIKSILDCYVENYEFNYYGDNKGLMNVTIKNYPPFPNWGNIPGGTISGTPWPARFIRSVCGGEIILPYPITRKFTGFIIDATDKEVYDFIKKQPHKVLDSSGTLLSCNTCMIGSIQWISEGVAGIAFRWDDYYKVCRVLGAYSRFGVFFVGDLED